MSWLEVVAGYAARQGLDPSVIRVLEAFGRPEQDGSPWRGLDLGDLDARAAEDPRARAAGIVAGLDGEVDPPQAQMFARRFLAVHALLGRIEAPEARVLRIGLVRRLEDLLDGPRPRALRVRALVDFYYSQGAVLHHRHRLRGRALPTVEERVTAASWREVSPGVEHATVAGDAEGGPIHLNLLRVRGARFATLRCPDGPPFERLVVDRGAVAGVSGGFFLYSEPDIAPPSRRFDPVGLLVQEGDVVGPPAFHRATFLQEGGGEVRIARIGMVGVQVRFERGCAVVVSAANTPGSGPVAFNRAWGPASPEHPGWTVAVVGREVVEVGRGELPIPLAGFALALPAGVAPPEVGAAVSYRIPGAPRAAMAGGPLLLDQGEEVVAPEVEDFRLGAPPATFTRDETLDQNLLPRLAVGLAAGGEVVFAAVDGRNFDRAPGATLRGTARLMAALGCVTAMNLDGGSSKRMVVGTEVVDLPSTEVVSGGGGGSRVRPVHSAILVFA